MLKNTESTVALEAISAHRPPPKGAYAYVERYIKGRGISPAAAARAVGVVRSTMSRLLNGGSLTEEMAAKLNIAYGLDPETLFNLEAKAHTYQTEVIRRELVLEGS